MSEQMVQEILAESISESRSVREQIVCQKCGSGKVQRVFRDGFLQQVVYPLFGFYPWRCTTCGSRTLRRKRRRRKTPGGAAAQRRRRSL
jgi:DNA-directed RNA polymerase subunit RPC12/RpoP